MFRAFAFNPIVHLFKIRIQVIGNRDRLPHKLLTAIQLVEQMTSGYTNLNLQVAIDYGGKNELVQTIKRASPTGRCAGNARM
jgi:undecaprenyl diphosphate synthase